MKKLLLLLTLLLLIAGSFYMGRFTAPAPGLKRASRQLMNHSMPPLKPSSKLRDTLALYKAHENFDDPLAAA